MKTTSSPANRPLQVGLFVTCLVDLFRPNVGFAAIHLLERAGCQVTVPQGQTCCGQPAYNNGDLPNARAIAKQVITAFDKFDYIVAPSGSCTGMLKHHYPSLFTDTPTWHNKALHFADRCYELVSFLTDVCKITEVTASFPYTVTYHDSCSNLRELNVKQQPRQLLRTIQGLTLVEMQHVEECCGFGGTFCVKYPELSTRIVSDKVSNIQATQAQVLLAGDMGCLLNITGRMKRLGQTTRVYHVAEVLAGMATVPAIGEGESA